MHRDFGRRAAGTAASGNLALPSWRWRALPAVAVANTGHERARSRRSVLVTSAGVSLLLSAVWKLIREEHRGVALWLFAPPWLRWFK
jgi:hypothetical protein